jgi:hypothetical protein
MTRTGLSGPHSLTFDAIAAAVTRRSAGVFVLGHADAQGRFCINHIGRSDLDLRARLFDCIGSETLFKYGYLPSSQAAFERECELFHDIRPPGTRVHPGRAQGTTWRCPRCSIYGQWA